MNAFKRKSLAGLVMALMMAMSIVGLAVAEDSITGTIAEKGDVIVLNAADGSYVLEGSDMAPEMIGKKVTVTGTVAEKDNIKMINVLSMEEVKE